MINSKEAKLETQELHKAINKSVAAYIDKHYWKYTERKAQKELEQFLYYRDKR